MKKNLLRILLTASLLFSCSIPILAEEGLPTAALEDRKTQPFHEVVKADPLENLIYELEYRNGEIENMIQLTYLSTGEEYPGSYTVSYKDAKGKEISQVEDAGNYTVVVTSTEPSYPGVIELPLCIERRNIADAIDRIYTIKNDEDVPVYYTGFPIEYIEALGTTTSGGWETTIYKSDYQITYKNNINAGEATAVITGINNYCGEYRYDFIISPAEQEVFVDPAQVRGLKNRTTLNRDCKLKLDFRFPNDVGKLTFASEIPSVATVSDDGVIRYHEVGNTTIYVITSGSKNVQRKTAYITVNVTKPGKPSFTPTPKKRGFVATSSTVRGAQGWQVRFSRFPDMKKATTLTYPNTGTKLYRQLNPTIFSGKRYYAQVRCWQEYNDKNHYSTWSAVKSFVTK